MYSAALKQDSSIYIQQFNCVNSTTTYRGKTPSAYTNCYRYAMLYCYRYVYLINLQYADGAGARSTFPLKTRLYFLPYVRVWSSGLTWRPPGRETGTYCTRQTGFRISRVRHLSSLDQTGELHPSTQQRALAHGPSA